MSSFILVSDIAMIVARNQERIEIVKRICFKVDSDKMPPDIHINQQYAKNTNTQICFANVVVF